MAENDADAEEVWLRIEAIERVLDDHRKEIDELRSKVEILEKERCPR